MSRSDAVSTDRQTLFREAAVWLTRLDAGTLSESEQQALHDWCQRSAEHQRVWQAACELNREFMRLPGQLARPVLNRNRAQRRTLLKSLAGIGLLMPLGWMLADGKSWQPLLADYRSAVGARRQVMLTDGTALMLNTDTALDVFFDAHQRRIRLYHGEVFVRTGKDPHRPFSVDTRQGRVTALGTEFAVHGMPAMSRVTVNRHAVSIRPYSGADTQRVEQGQQCLFAADGIKSVQEAPADSLAWRRGELVVDNWPLQSFVEALSRYRPGVMRCTDAVADVRVSGVFQTDNTEQALEVLQQIFGLKVTRYSDYWVLIGASEPG